jgi:tRNA threonylcarbamoyl adenosine modification protein YeaZ
MILALDTSGLELLVALVADGEELLGRALPGPRHQDQVIQVIGEVAGDRLAGLEAVAVANGPGSHTGLRVGLATASGIAFARRLPIYPLSSLAVAAQRAPAETASVIAAVAAGRGRVYVQPFERAGNGYRAAADRHLETVEALAARAAEGITVAAEPALLAQLGHPASDRSGVRALTAAVVEAVGAIQPVNYDQLRGDYGEF